MLRLEERANRTNCTEERNYHLRFFKMRKIDNIRRAFILRSEFDRA